MIEADLAHIRLLSRIAQQEALHNDDYEMVLKVEAELQTYLVLIEGIKKNETEHYVHC